MRESVDSLAVIRRNLASIAGGRLLSADQRIATGHLTLDAALDGGLARGRVHVGGYVLTEGRLDEIVPIHNGAMVDRTFIEWDKDDIDALGLMKVDVLALGMCKMRKAQVLETIGLGRRDRKDHHA